MTSDKRHFIVVRDGKVIREPGSGNFGKYMLYQADGPGEVMAPITGRQVSVIEVDPGEVDNRYRYRLAVSSQQ